MADSPSAEASADEPSMASKPRQMMHRLQTGLERTPPALMSATQSELTARMGLFSVNSPVAVEAREIPSALSAPSSLFAQNREILLSGLPASPRSATGSLLSPPPPPPATPAVVQAPAASQLPRVGSLSSSSRAADHELRATASRQLTPLVTPNQPVTISPCVYVNAVGLQQLGSSTSSTTGNDSAKNADSGSSGKTGQPTKSRKTGSTGTRMTPPPEGRFLVSALVRPCSAEKEPFVLEREFDLEKLIMAVPEPDRQNMSPVNVLPSPVLWTPLKGQPAFGASSSSGTHDGHMVYFPSSSPSSSSPYSSSPPSASAMDYRARGQSPLSPPSPGMDVRQTRKRLSRQQGRQSRQQSRPHRNRQQSHPTQYGGRNQIGGSIGVPVPMKPHTAQGFLPALAAVILSGRVKPGDSIDIAVPHPDAWAETIGYIYRGNGEATEAIRQNIAHLGGKLD